MHSWPATETSVITSVSQILRHPPPQTTWPPTVSGLHTVHMQLSPAREQLWCSSFLSLLHPPLLCYEPALEGTSSLNVPGEEFQSLGRS